MSAVKVAPAALIERGVIVYAIDLGAHTLHFGDGSSRPGDTEPVRYAYAAPGDYMVTAKDPDSGAVLATDQIRIRNGLEPAVTVAEDPASPGYIAVTIQDTSDYEITWDADTVRVLTASRGTVLSRPFRDGVHPIMVRDLRSLRALSRQITVAPREYDPDITVTQGADAQTAVVTLTTLKTPDTDVTVNFGDGHTATMKAAKLNDTATHAYRATGSTETYSIEVNYADGHTPGVGKLVTIPWPTAGEAG